MKKYLFPALVTTLLVSSCIAAENVKWLERGNVKSATITDTNVSKSTDAPAAEKIVTLATGQKVVLTGGVYVKSGDTAKVLEWASANNYIALEDKYIAGAIHITAPAEESINVANMISQIDGVTTAAPKYRAPVVPK